MLLNVPRVYEIKICGVAGDLVRAEFDDVELWEAPGVTWLRTGWTDTAELYGLINRIETLGLVLLEVGAVDGESEDPARRSHPAGSRRVSSPARCSSLPTLSSRT